MPTENKPAESGLRFNTPDAGRTYIANLFKTVLRRHDYRQYIHERLAGDFACTLAEHFEGIKAREAALQADLDAKDQRVDELMGLLREAWSYAQHPQNVVATPSELGKLIDAALNPNPEAPHLLRILPGRLRWSEAMSNNEMVNAPRELLERVMRAGVWAREYEELHVLLTAPAEQFDEAGDWMDPVQSVPPAGGEPEVVGYGGINALGGFMHNDGYLMVSAKPERYLDVPLTRLEHVTRLLAELARAKDDSEGYRVWGGGMRTQRNALQSELDALKAQPQGEPVGHVYTMEALVPGGSVRHHAELYRSLPSGTKLYASPPAPVAVVPTLSDEIALLRSILKGYEPSMARADALRAVRVIERLNSL
ncbi:hypothetical protein ACA087_00560 [Pseudomonas chlororaphis]|uniref:hypothetical protein n=1 Tax=Pseudomonas chlororaphis TaxID=587753 RepID=UPI003529E391